MSCFFRRESDGSVVYVVEEKCVKTKRSEFAAWWTEVEIEAGVYPAKVFPNGSAVVSIPAVIVADNHQSHFAGVPVGVYDQKQNAGKPTFYTSFAYPFDIHDS